MARMGPTPIPPITRVLRRITIAESGCWLWPGACTGSGYGRVSTSEGLKVTHRVIYEFLVGPVPEGLELDHLCRERRCCNPDHLEPVTRRENLRRGIQAQRSKTHCPQGHSYDEANTYIDKRGGRSCRACRPRWRR